MARPLPTGKKSVNLATQGPRVSRIRRDPPPKAKPEDLIDPKELERRAVVIGVLVFTLAVMAIVFAVSSYNGWTPRQYTVEV